MYVYTDDYITKELLIEAVIFSNKRKHSKTFPQGVSIRTCLRSVQESGYFFKHIETKTDTTPRAKSRSFLKAELEALAIRAHMKNANIEEILSDIPRGLKNINPKEKQYSIPCPYFGLGDCTKTFCVAKKWWDLRPLNSAGTSNQIYVHWSNHNKGLYDMKKIPHLVLIMAENHLRNLYYHGIFKHGGNHYPYFSYNEKNRRSYQIKADASVRKERHGSQLTEINSDTNARMYVVNKAEPYMSVHRVIF